jgi:hypothetical protein
MVQPTPLHYVNGGEPLQISCANCGTVLGNERCVTSTPGGPKFFCKADPEQTEDSCFNQWRRKRH